MDFVNTVTHPIIGMSAAEIAQRIANGEISASEVVEAHIQRIEEVNSRLNAVVVPLFEQARAEAKAADAKRTSGKAIGTLHGVPITIKDSFDVKGCITGMGFTDATQPAAQNGVLVERLKQAGAIILGKTNVAQMLTLNESDNPVYGRTNNPWNPERTPGGSTGGEAAIIAVGGSCLGLGSDIGGSVRMPAHACGINSLKPTARRLTLAGHTPLFPGQQVIVTQPGPMARSVADLSLAMQILAAPGQEEFDPSIPPVPWHDPATVEVEKLRVAFYTDNGVIRPAPAIRRAVREAAEVLAKRGVIIEEWKPPNLLRGLQLYIQLISADGYATLKQQMGKSIWDTRIKRYYQLASTPKGILCALAATSELIGQHKVASYLRAVGKISVAEYWRVIDERDRYCAEFRAAMNARKYDAIICPSNALPALTHGSGFFLSEETTYTSLYNLLGMPAGVVAATRVRPGEESDRQPGNSPIERSAYKIEQGSVGLPVGIQVAAHHWREDIVLAVMSTLEEHFKSQPDYPAYPSL
ncbi:amidase [Kalymmatonema gypsitolerans NIES-4073]|nr:amidase [Scytonema sp. NIES-4073]